MIRFFTEIPFKNYKKQKLTRWIKRCILNENKKVGELNIIFCDDAYLLNINREYLNHDYYTDVISFDNSFENVVAGDIYISIDTVTDNAKERSIVFYEELKRVIIHGILHFMGYKDKTEEEIIEIRLKEDYCLSLYEKQND